MRNTGTGEMAARPAPSCWRPSFGPRLPAPKQAKSLSVPADERIGLHDDEGVLPVEHSGQRRHRESRGVIGTAWRLLTLDEEGELLSEKEILRGQSALRMEEIPSEREGIEDSGQVPEELRKLIYEMATSNVTWGEERIAHELLVKLGIRVSPRTVRKYMPSQDDSDRGARHSSQRWATFVRNHAKAIVAADFVTVVTARFHFLYVFVVMEVGTRKILFTST